MNMFEKMCFFFSCVIGVLFGWWLGCYIGGWAWIIGITGGILLFGGIRYILCLFYKWRPMRPICRLGKCKADDYDYIKTTEGGVVFICKCGGFYILTKGEFREILPNGTTMPYMKRNRFGQWINKSVKEKCLSAPVVPSENSIPHENGTP